MSAYKSGNHIYIAGTGNTLASITSDIADTTFIEKVSTAPDIYEVKGNVIRYLQVLANGVLTIGDPKDYSKNETLRFAPGANDRNRFNILSGGALYMYGDTKVIFSTHATYYSNCYWDGKSIIQGDETYRPVLETIYRLSLRQTDMTDVGAAFNYAAWDKMDIINYQQPLGSGYVAINNYMDRIGDSWSFTDILIDGVVGGATCSGYGLNLSFDPAGQMGKIVFDNIEMRNCVYPFYNYTGGIKLTNCNIHDNYYYGALNVGSIRNTPYYASDRYDETQGFFGQRFTYFKDCTFTNNYISSANKQDITSSAGHMVMIEGCTFESTKYSGSIVEAGMLFIKGTGNTFSGSPHWYVANGGRIYWIKELTATVYDSAGTPLSGATITVRQKDDKEVWMFQTDTNGEVITDPGLDKKIILVWREGLDGNESSFSDWSDASTGTYHTITVSKEGYEPYTAILAMSADRTVDVYLRKLPSKSRVITPTVYKAGVA